MLATEIRQKFKIRADAIEEARRESDLMQVEESKEPVPSLKRNYLPIPRQKIEKKLLLGHEHNTASPKKKRLRLS